MLYIKRFQVEFIELKFIGVQGQSGFTWLVCHKSLPKQWINIHIKPKDVDTPSMSFIAAVLVKVNSLLLSVCWAKQSLLAMTVYT